MTLYDIKGWKVSGYNLTNYYLTAWNETNYPLYAVLSVEHKYLICLTDAQAITHLQKRILFYRKRK